MQWGHQLRARFDNTVILLTGIRDPFLKQGFNKSVPECGFSGVEFS